MSALIEMLGRRFGKWTVIARPAGNTERQWTCQCDCGRVSNVAGRMLRNGKSASCGCAIRLASSKAHRVHGRSGKKNDQLYVAWMNMRRRCRIDGRYVARGIRVCDQWATSFESFALDMGDPPSPDHSLDRIDNDGNYEPGNVRWATAKEQSRNTRRTLLSADDVREIHGRLEYGESPASIARRFGIRTGHVCRIKTGAIWRDIYMESN